MKSQLCDARLIPLNAQDTYIAFYQDHVLFNHSYANKRILEVGSGGYGWLTLLLMKHHKPVMCCTSDIQLWKMKLAKKIAHKLGYESTYYLVADAKHLPFKREVFNMVTGNAVLHHLLSNIDGAAKEFHYVLKPNGELVFSNEIVASRFANFLLPLLYMMRSAKGEGATTTQGWINAFRGQGFKDVRVKRENTSQYKSSFPLKLYYRVLNLLPEWVSIKLLATSCMITASL